MTRPSWMLPYRRPRLASDVRGLVAFAVGVLLAALAGTVAPVLWLLVGLLALGGLRG